MNKHERAEVKKIILKQIDSLTNRLPTLGDAPDERLRLERLEAALKRIGAETFGVCFKCEVPMPLRRLRDSPESIICDGCLEESPG